MEKIKLFCVSLGCDKNLVDTEKMLGVAGGLGVSFTDDETEADAILINTCCFIGDAKEESVNTILDMARYKEEGKCRALIVAGCLAQRYKQEIIDEIPEVDAILGTTSYEEIGNVLTRLFEENGEEKKAEHISCFHDLKELPTQAEKRVMTTGGHYAFLKIAEGCDKRCTYCIIPYLRGPYRSVPMEQLLAEARELADNGVRELILVAQETTLYGKDLYGEKSLPKLLHELAQIPGIYWIRIQYCYPEEITDELIQTIKSEEKVCHYLDIPIQHASDRILRRMGRRTHKAELKERISALRREIPDIALRTTFICGFPGETQEDHEELMEFVDEMEFERVGVFTYSAEEDTPAYSYPDQIPEEVKEERRADVMELQQEIAFEHCENMVGKVLDVIIEGKVADEPAYVGRTYMDAPNVDGLIFVNADEMLMSGDFVRVKVTGANEYDLIGEVYHESAE
ncbi:MAG: 30S ribosomal protein S12 methylthiotransferase RimO [Clostridium sp.]|nr:30S ribosomal protein S12 methylthiotransferase RimO [Clostridium sp.]